jgi:hypothetical protein
MTEQERAALAALRFSWAQVPDDVWRPSPFHVDGLHPAVVRDVVDGIAQAVSSPAANPIGLALAGRHGTGKTHLLGWVREQVQQQGGYFFLVGILDGRTFWDGLLIFLLDGLARPAAGGDTQLLLLLRRLSSRIGAPRAARRAVMGETELTRPALDAFLDGLAEYDRHVALQCRDTARALALRASDVEEHQDIADSYFTRDEETTPGERRAWGIRSRKRTAQELVRDISWLLALTGPSVVAFDQIDTAIAQAAMREDLAKLSPAEAGLRQDAELVSLAAGLSDLRETTRRTLTVVAVLSANWELIENRATASFADRFRRCPALQGIASPALATEIIKRRFATRFSAIEFTPDYPTWPVRPEAFADAKNYTPRRLLVEIDRHIRACLIDDEVRELHSLADVPPEDLAERAPARTAPRVSDEAMNALDARFEQLRREADVVSPIEHDTEDASFPALLSAGLRAWIVERGDRGRMFSLDPPPSAKPDLHARLRRALDERSEEERETSQDQTRTEDQVHWSFRAISDTHHGVGALNRIRRARTASGLTADVAKRRLFLLRNGPWSSSAKTKEVMAQLVSDGGVTLPVDEADLRVLSALRVLWDENPPDLQAWLVRYRPAEQVTLFKEALADADDWTPAGGPTARAEPRPATDPSAGRDSGHGSGRTQAGPDAGHGSGRTQAGPDAGRGSEGTPAGSDAGRGSDGTQAGPDASHGFEGTPGGFDAGYGYEDDAPVRLSLDALRKHAAIFASSGSGKTVLIRHLVEECALQGVSAIVLDPNNDLARLGDAWPQPPDRWRPGDAERAAEYLSGTEVVIWTPRRESGRPLSFQPLPDFPGVRDDPDEFDAAVESAVAALAPRANLAGRSQKTHLGQAVLRRTVEHFGRQGGTDVRGLIALLSDLPDGISGLDDAVRIASGLAQTLTASMDNDPMFGGDGTPADPGILLTPSAGKRARISVISLVGLPSDDVRQSFVNQLQMGLFAWIRKHPATDRPLLGLLVMDEAQTFAPSGAMTACTQSTLALASQARKYGLGLLFATQMPKGLHNRIPGNAATHFFGRLSVPAQIDAAREMAKVKGGDVPDIGNLTAGEFYVALEGEAPRKVRTPLCLSHHPSSPLTDDEVMARARAHRDR